MRTNQAGLIAAAMDKGEATASSWRAYRDTGLPSTGSVYDTVGVVEVWHYNTPMFRVWENNGQVDGLDAGWGSMSDKCGVRKILTGYGIDKGYADIFG